MSNMPEKFVVVPDPHGNVALFETICRAYGDDVQYVIAGDAVDGPGVNQLLDRIISVDGVLVRGNHEQYLLGSMLEAEEDAVGAERRRDIVNVWRGIHRGTLESYSIYGGPTPDNAHKLRDRMDALGHLALLRESPMYFEADDFVVLHADVTAEPWGAQKAELDAERARNLEGHYWGWSAQYLMPQQLGEAQVTPHAVNLVRSGLTKRLISGHFHLDTEDLDIRSLNSGQHLLLAGGHDRGFSVVYESWTQRMQVISVD